MNNERPLFSFLTTAYRTEGYIGQTIDSVLAQTFDDWELVVVDNGNSDEMAAIVDEYSSLDPRIRLIRQENRGYRGGVMAASAAARGEFVCVLDSDDHLLPGFCERIAKLIANEPTVDAVCVDAERFSEPDDIDLAVPYMRSIGITTTADPTHRLTFPEVLGGRVPYYTAAIRRTAWDAVGGYDPGIDDADESVIIWCRLSDSFDVRMLPDRLARYRVRADSLSRDPDKVESFEQQLMRSFEEGAKASTEPEHQEILARTLRHLRYHQEIRRARYALLLGDVAVARASAKAAFGQRHTMRAAVVIAGLTVAPGVMRRMHPSKQWLTDAYSKAKGRATRARRR
ncbi:glycosyltransferase family 2 protein [Aldersonia kunmingensis]|uniref:glycosyltransferase family 2 protein n=1 Tax=Aldersonia kunmingensis TaxID=408066 RepID=UPI000829EA3E|nr:glycosyltransferase family 2 protein [Aldersonia kunmingensis]